MSVVMMEIERRLPGRLPRWDPGVRGRIPEIKGRLVLTPEYIGRYASFTDALNAAILEVQAPGAVVIPTRSEPYDLTGPVQMRSHVVVRGEGPARTQVRARLAGEGSGVDGSGFHAVFRFQGDTIASLDVVQAVEPGSRALVVGPHVFGVRPEVGQQLILTMENDPAHGWNRFDWEKRVRGQVLQVTAVDGNKVWVDTEVRLPYPMSSSPAVELCRPIEGAGLEDLYIINDAQTKANWDATFWRAANCWVRNCDIERVPDIAFHVWNSRWITVEGCYVHGALDYSGGKGYGVNVCAHSSDCLVADNIFEQLRHSMMVQFGASGNVFAYNYSCEPAMSDIALHGWYGYMNLFEGNAATQIYVDNAWGRSGARNTFFRNRLKKFAADYEARLGIHFKDYADHVVESIQVEPDSDQQNIIANTVLDSRLVLRGCRDTWVERNLLVDLPPQAPAISIDGVVTGTVDIENRTIGLSRDDAAPSTLRPSLFLDAAPHFWVPAQKRWPAIGADVDRLETGKYETIPAQDRYAKVGPRRGFGPRTPTLSAYGQTTGTVGHELVFRMVSRHSEAGVLVRYVIDWGDGADGTVEATAFTQSGLVFQRAHVWARAGQFDVKCLAKDQYGDLSGWSRALRITIR